MTDRPTRIPFYAARLSDLAERPDVMLVAECCDCGHAARLDTGALAVAYGGREQLRWIERRLRCARCGKRAGLLRIVYADDPEEG